MATSCNISGEKSISSISEIPEEIKSKVDVIIDDCVLDNKPSKVIDFSGDGEEVIRG